MFRHRAPEHRLPAPPQGIAGQRAHTLDLRLNGGQIDRSLQHIRPPAARRLSGVPITLQMK
jgi:hypothetical protein